MQVLLLVLQSTSLYSTHAEKMSNYLTDTDLAKRDHVQSTGGGNSTDEGKLQIYIGTDLHIS